jgi:acyl dehydratase
VATGTISLVRFAERIGREVGVSEIELSRSLVDLLADATIDRSIMHVDPQH